MNNNDSPSPSAPFDLNRFVQAQNGVYMQALGELKRGRKTTHWMWFIFPQIEGLGHSSIAQHYAIKSLAEARAYLQHPVLGPRLIECCEAILLHQDLTASQIFGYPDDMKLRSSVTLFSLVTTADSIFQRVLDQFFNGEEDENTLELVED
jgi:uncharacterized protein (DUF1810 family)